MLIVGDPIYLDIEKFPDLVIITKEEADAYAANYPKREFVVTGPIKEKFKSFTDYVKRHKR